MDRSRKKLRELGRIQSIRQNETVEMEGSENLGRHPGGILRRLRPDQHHGSAGLDGFWQFLAQQYTNPNGPIVKPDIESFSV
jgi:hypothetical protein